MPGVPRIARQATADELTNILTDYPAETVQAAVALLQAAQKSDVPATAAALLEELPGEIGLPLDDPAWTDDQVEQALALLESACVALQKFPKSFKAHMAWQVGQLFGLQAPPANWNDTLQAAQSWRVQSAGGLNAKDLSGSRDARDLIHVLDDAPHNFEQAFLNALPSRMGLCPFEEWAGMSVRDDYLRRLREARVHAEQVAIEIGQRQPLPPSMPKPTLPSRPPEPARPVVTPPELHGIPPSPVTSVSPATGPAVTVETGERYEPSAMPATVTPSEPVTISPAVEEAFIQVQPIFERLIPSDRRALLRKLRQRYDPS
jgi:hypothetical protein